MEDRQGQWSLSVVFPAYNEASNIAQSVVWARRVLKPVCSDFEILIVDDGSVDQTGEIGERLAEEDERVRVLHHPQNRGYGAALRSGIASSKKQLILIVGADLQFDLDEIPRFLGMAEAYDIVVGNRVRRRDPFMRKLNAWGWNSLGWLLFGVGLPDINCGFKLFHRNVFERMTLQATGAMIDTEILVQARRAGFRVMAIPVSHFPRPAGKSTGASPMVIVRAFKELVQLYRKLHGRIF